MVEYRNQHFVPELLLEGWATDDRVVTLHFESGHEEPNQDISKICSKNYLYTPRHDTQLEQELGSLEGHQAKPIQTLRKGIAPSKISKSAYRCLCSYIFTQRLRTRMYRKELLETGEQVYDGSLRLDYWELINPQKELRLDEQVFEALRKAKLESLVKQVQNYLMMHGFLGLLLYDLDVVLVRNQTDQEFICSDSPVVFDNIRFKHEIDQYYPGAANRGFIAYCPISPERYVVLYDPLIYFIEHDGENRFLLDDPKVVEMLNRFQMMNSDDVVVYSEPSMRDRLLDMHSDSPDIARYETVPKQLTTSFEIIEYEIPPTQPLPDTGNFFDQIHVNSRASYTKQRSPELVEKSKDIVHRLLDESDSTPKAAIKAIRLAIKLFEKG